MRIPGTHGKTLLHIAARRNFAGLCRWLLRLGANVDQTDILERTALHHAAQHDAVDAATLLIEQGADTGAKDWQGRTPIDLAGGESSTAGMIRKEVSLRHAQCAKAVTLQQDRKRNTA